MRVRVKELHWDASQAADIDVYDVYGEVGAEADFGARADAGTAPLLGSPAASPFPLSGLADGVWQFAVVARDKAGNTADPALVTGIPLDQTAPDPVTNLAVAFVV